MTGILSMTGILNSVNIPGILSKRLEHDFLLAIIFIVVGLDSEVHDILKNSFFLKF